MGVLGACIGGIGGAVGACECVWKKWAGEGRGHVPKCCSID